MSAATAQQLLQLSRETELARIQGGLDAASAHVLERAAGGDGAALQALREAWAQMLERHIDLACWRQPRAAEIRIALQNVVLELGRWKGRAHEALAFVRGACAHEVRQIGDPGDLGVYVLLGGIADDVVASIGWLALTACRFEQEERLFRQRLVDLATLRPVRPLARAVHPAIYTALDDVAAAAQRARMTVRAEQACRARGWAGEKEPTE